MSEALLPCPFCGGVDMRWKVAHGAGTGMHHDGEDVWYMNCYTCGVQFPGMYAEHGRKSLITKWNTRPALAQAQPARHLPPYDAVSKILNAVMELAVGNGANSISMPDEYVEVALWLSHEDKAAQPSLPDPAYAEPVKVRLLMGSALEAALLASITEQTGIKFEIEGEAG